MDRSCWCIIGVFIKESQASLFFIAAIFPSTLSEVFKDHAHVILHCVILKMPIIFGHFQTFQHFLTFMFKKHEIV